MTMDFFWKEICCEDVELAHDFKSHIAGFKHSHLTHIETTNHHTTRLDDREEYVRYIHNLANYCNILGLKAHYEQLTKIEEALNNDSGELLLEVDIDLIEAIYADIETAIERVITVHG